MEIRDLIVTPLVIILVYIVAWLVRPFVTDSINRKYFFPALTLKIIGAIALGFIYQFYYRGGDTFNYHTFGSRIIWEAFMESPANGLKIFLFPNDQADVYSYSSRILFLTDPSSFAVVRVAFIFDLFTFSSYAATAVLFAVVSFMGMWMFFLTFYKIFPHLYRGIALAAFFIPSVFFWGSGILKDTISLGCLGIAVYMTYRVFLEGRFSFINICLLFLSLYVLAQIKVYIAFTFLPSAIVWVFMANFGKIRSLMLRIIIFPAVIVIASGLAYYSVLKAGETNSKYSIDRVAETAKITAYDIRYYTGRDAGSGYSLGELDGTLGSMLRLAPQAINVSLFRPYLWEVNNPLMLLSALESFTLLIGVCLIVLRSNIYALRTLSNGNVIFLLVFSVAFAFAVGVSTFNFGTLVRYKIPMLPFFVVMLTIMYDQANKLRKLDEFDWTE